MISPRSPYQSVSINTGIRSDRLVKKRTVLFYFRSRIVTKIALEFRVELTCVPLDIYWDKCEDAFFFFFLAQTKGRREKQRERKRKGKEEEGKEKGKGKLEVKLWQKRKKSQTPQPGIEPGTPANAADALPLSHRDKQYHQPCMEFVWNFIRSASTSQHRHLPMPTADNPLRSGDPSWSPLCITHGLKE